MLSMCIIILLETSDWELIFPSRVRSSFWRRIYFFWQIAEYLCEWGWMYCMLCTWTGSKSIAVRSYQLCGVRTFVDTSVLVEQIKWGEIARINLEIILDELKSKCKIICSVKFLMRFLKYFNFEFSETNERLIRQTVVGSDIYGLTSAICFICIFNRLQSKSNRFKWCVCLSSTYTTFSQQIFPIMCYTQSNRYIQNGSQVSISSA